jgi:type IV pilus biogenesis protein CpaD/CtpE
VLRRVVLLVAAAALVAGCGVRNSTPFTPKATAACLSTKGFTSVTTDPGKVGFVAAFADDGGLRATSPDHNVLTIAFAADAEEASTTSLEDSFRSHAPASLRPHMGDIMSVNRNAVIVWTISPSSDDSDAVNRCLRS